MIRYAWTFGDTGTSTSANPSRTYAAPGTYTVTLTVTDVWGKAGTVTHDRDDHRAGQQQRADRGDRVRHLHHDYTTCTMSATGSSDPDTAGGDGIRNYLWSWGDGTPDTTGTRPASRTSTTCAGTYTVTLRVLDKWGRASDTGQPRGDHRSRSRPATPPPTVDVHAQLHRPDAAR